MLKMFDNTIKISKELLDKINNIVEYQTKQLKREINKDINK
tara:strand:- start:355 stop:477 length:123 start_codon:yes stop_codon:yes gene_type:complete